MGHKVFIRHTYIFKCSNIKCNNEWKINEASDLDKLTCPHCSKRDSVEYVREDQRNTYNNKFGH